MRRVTCRVIVDATLRAGSGDPLVLMHGVTGTNGMWRRLMPLPAPHHDTVAFTALGHHGGNATRSAAGSPSSSLAAAGR